MKTIWRWAPTTTLFWSALAHGQSPPVPPEPPIEPAPPSEMPALNPTSDAPQLEVIPLDQGPDTLPPLEEEPTPPPLSPPPAAVVVSSGAPRKLPPVRADRRLALLGELGWNSLAGFGVNLSYHAHPHLSFDLGVGLALIGGKLGLRVRYNLFDSKLTPFIGAGFLAGSGFDAPTGNIAPENDNRELNIKLGPSAFLQTVAGIDFTGRDGFTLVGALGYAWLLTGDNVEVITGEPTAEELRGFDIAFRSSIVISIAIGYSFQ